MNVPLVISEDFPFGKTSLSLAAIRAQGLSQVSCKWTSANPNTSTGSLSVAVSQHSANASSSDCSTGRSSRPFISGTPPHEPLKKEDLTVTLHDSVVGVMDSLLVDSSRICDAIVSNLSSCKQNSWHCTLGEGQQSSAIHLPGQMSSLWAFKMPFDRIQKQIISRGLQQN